MDLTLNLPIYIRLGKGPAGRFSLNLNTYRNAHFHTLNRAKVEFEKIVAQRMGHLPKMVSTELTYSLFFGSHRTIDISNICCIVDKFFCDTLVNQGKLIDDNKNVISKVTYQWGGVDKYYPRIEVTLSNIQPIEEPMQIILTQQEIEEAIKEVVLSQITLREDQGIAIAFEGVRDGGLTVHVTIQKLDEYTSPKKVRTKRAIQAEESVTEPAKAHIVPESLSQPIEAPKMPIFTQGSGGEAPVPLPTTKIFPDINSSAPVQEKRQEPAAGPTSGSPKSLFSNLTKPVHDSKE